MLGLPLQEAQDLLLAGLYLSLDGLHGSLAEPALGQDGKVVSNELASVGMMLDASKPIRGVHRIAIPRLVDPRRLLLSQLDRSAASASVKLRIVRISEGNRGILNGLPEHSPKKGGVAVLERLTHGWSY